jgi:subtilisin family serine protease
VGVFVVALAVAIGTSLTAGATSTPVQAKAPGVPGDRQQPAPRTLTLITGDRVTSYGADRITTTPRKGVTFLSYRANNHQYVIPSDAVALLRANRLDLRLFDITGLLEAGVDKRADLPLIVSGGSNAKGLTAQRSLAAVRGYGTKVDKTKLADTWSVTRPSLTSGKVWLDGLRKPTLDESVPQIGAPAAWAAGFDGTGVKVAVLDTGIDATHPDLAGAVTATKNFAGEFEDGLDHVGHGTHVASTIAGTGAASGGKYRGVAPGASLLDGKVCATFGCEESWILEGMQWAAESGASVVNMSLGTYDTPDIDPIEQAVNDLTAQYGVLFVVAAGNNGADGTVGSPASADAALAVGAVTKTDALADFSSRGPRAGDNAVKPEITAPGVDIMAARSKDSSDGNPGDLYISHSGTSMATPHVAGAAAILTQVHPQWSPELRKAALMASAKPNPAIGVFAQGAGRVDVARAYTQAVTTTPASVSFGQQDYPHDDDPVLDRSLAYHNASAAPLTLNLTLSTTAPAGMFVLGASSVTIPAGGDAAVTLTADTRVGGDQVGNFGGQVTATAAGVSVQTPFGVVREIEVHKVHVTAKDRAGLPAAAGSVTVLAPTGGQRNGYVTFEPDVTLRVVPGTYFAVTYVMEPDNSTDMLVYPTLDVESDQTLAMDGRLARGYDVTVPGPDATPVGANVDVVLTVRGDNYYWANVTGPTFGSIYTAHLGPKDVPGLLVTASGLLAKADSGGDFTNSPYSYQVGWYSNGEVFTGLTRHVRKADLATIRAQYAANAVGGRGGRANWGIAPDSPGASAVWAPVTLPSRRTEYFAGNLAWMSDLYESVVGPDGQPQLFASSFGQPTTYQAGQEYEDRWNTAVFGPNLTGLFPYYQSVYRSGDRILAYPYLYSDASGRRQGSANSTTGRTALYRDGQLVGETAQATGYFTVPPQPGQYRLEVREERSALARLSTMVESVWTFNSSHVDAATSLPVMGLTFSPKLDELNTGRAGSVGAIPINVSYPQGTSAPALTALTVDVSYDDGASWHTAPVVHAAGKWLLTTRYANRAGFVSLRAQATDSAGNTVRQTIIRAFELR